MTNLDFGVLRLDGALGFTPRDSLTRFPEKAVAKEFQSGVKPPHSKCCRSKCAARISRFAVFNDDCRCHTAEWSLARGNRVGCALDQAERIGFAGIRGEVVDLIVEQDAEFRHDHKTAERQVDRFRAGYRITVLVHDGKMTRATVVVCKEATVILHRSRLLQINPSRDLCGIFCVEQFCDGDFNEVCVTEKLRTIREGVLE